MEQVGTRFQDLNERPANDPPATLQHRAIPSLDGLRAVSIILVLASHAELVAGLEWLSPFSVMGAFGVHVFFVISGYLITTLLMQEYLRDGRVSLGRFYFRRSLRIFPAYYVFLGVVFFLGTQGVLNTNGARWWPAVIYVSNVFSTKTWLTVHSWSLSVEEQFYLTWPIVFAATGVIRGRRIVLGVALIAPLARGIVLLTTHDPWAATTLNHDFIMWGCALALSFDQVRLSRYRRFGEKPWAAPLLLACAGILHAVIVDHTRMAILAEQTLEAVLIAAGVACAILTTSGPFWRLLNSPPARWIGVLSYSIYLWQELYLGAGKYWVRWPAPAGASALVLVILSAILSYLMIERPTLSLRRRFESRR